MIRLLFQNRLVRRMTLIAGVVASLLLTSNPVEAHFPILRHHHHYGYFGPRHFSYFGPGFGYYSSYRPFLHRSYAFGYYTYPWYYPSYYPVYVAPTYYSYSVPAISWPITTYYDQPVCVAPAIGTSSYYVQHATVQNLWADNQSTNAEPKVLRRDVDNAVKFASATLAADPTKAADPSNLPFALSDSRTEDSTKVIISRKPVLLKPYSPIWTKAAVGLVDNMIEEGRFDDAVSSCKSMEKISDSKGAGVYLRQGIMTFFANSNQDSTTLDRALDQLNDACLAGSRLTPEELDQRPTLTHFLNACSNVDVQVSMDELSKKILAKPNTSTKELILLAALLKLDGQSDRAKLFAIEANNHEGRMNRWTSVLNASME